jgi:DNA-directed RNA polymerase subunit RPC12/RpoP
MKLELTIPDHLPEIKEADLKAAAQRRDRYSLARDVQAREFNEAIVSRLLRDREKLESSQSEDYKLVKCGTCGKEFSVDSTTKDPVTCSECSQNIEID